MLGLSPRVGRAEVDYDDEGVIEWITCDRCLERMAGRGHLPGSPTESPAVAGLLRGADDGTRTHDLLHGKCPSGVEMTLIPRGCAPVQPVTSVYICLFGDKVWDKSPA
jgi:hypothetical protein